MKLFQNGMVVPALVIGLGMSFMALAQGSPEEFNVEPSSQPAVSQQEVKDFMNEMRNIQKEAKQVLKDLGNMKGYDEVRTDLNAIVSETVSCLTKLAKSASDEKRDIIDECRQANFWDRNREARESFVPQREINNVTSDIKRQLGELSRFKKQLAKMPNASGLSSQVDGLTGQLNDFKNKLGTLTGQDLREVMQEYWDLRIWELINSLRGRIEIPKQLAQIVKDLNRLKKQLSASKYKKVYEFFAVDPAAVDKLVVDKQSAIDQINASLAGDGEDANDLMNEHIHQGWHPGDLDHLLNMLRETYDKLKGIKDQQMKDAIMEIMVPIVEALNAGEVRQARDAMQPFAEQLRRYEYLFRAQYNPNTGFDKKSTQALDKLEQLIGQKFQQFEQQAGQGAGGGLGDGMGGGPMPIPAGDSGMMAPPSAPAAMPSAGF